MRTLFGMILGALMLVGGVYVYDSMQTSSVANGQVAQANRTREWHSKLLAEGLRKAGLPE